MIFFPFSRDQCVDTFLLHNYTKNRTSEAKSPSSMKFLALVQALTAHHLVVSGSLTQTTPVTQELNPETFSARQKQTLNGMVEGKTNSQLASELGYSVFTIRHETMRIFRIMGVDDRKSAAEFAVKYELVR